MERPLTLEALEDAIVRHCAAVLLGARPASMFTFLGDFASPTAAQRARRARLAHLLDACERELAGGGIRIRVLAWRPCGAIVFAYRPDLLAQHLGSPRVARMLMRMGYRIAAEPSAAKRRTPAAAALNLDALLAQLGTRFSCATGLPHEMGFFLGYPYEDVMGFIEHHGRDFICFGCWKVYANPRRALRSFSRFKRCGRRAARLRSAGATLADLARPAARR